MSSWGMTHDDDAGGGGNTVFVLAVVDERVLAANLGAARRHDPVRAHRERDDDRAIATAGGCCRRDENVRIRGAAGEARAFR
mmetsp:Transcript_38441/g.46911  ORF Transcript_38441/g.46911 Transcript_38441/m.46911 type:complete len:82 (-) Transcript_38441:90-335(-)